MHKLCADEALFVGDPRHRNALYGLITEPTVEIEPKFIDVYSAVNYVNTDIISNAKHFVPVTLITDAGDLIFSDFLLEGRGASPNYSLLPF
jgi:hypothetical protein